MSLFDKISGKVRNGDSVSHPAYPANFATDFLKGTILANTKLATGTPSASASKAVACTPSNKKSFALAPIEIADDITVAQVDPTHDPQDDRRFCTQCLNLRGRACIVAAPGALVSANRGYHPMREVLHRCAGYWPDAGDHDQRRGVIRWPMI